MAVKDAIYSPEVLSQSNKCISSSTMPSVDYTSATNNRNKTINESNKTTKSSLQSKKRKTSAFGDDSDDDNNNDNNNEDGMCGLDFLA